jgi:hypothetical protein
MDVKCRKVITEILQPHQQYLSDVGYSKLSDPSASFQSYSQHTAMEIRTMLHRLYRTSTDIKYPSVIILPTLAQGDRGFGMNPMQMADVVDRVFRTNYRKRLCNAVGVGQQRVYREVYGKVVDLDRVEHRTVGSTGGSLIFFDNFVRIVGKELHLVVSAVAVCCCFT